MHVHWRPRLRNAIIGVATLSTVFGLALASVVSTGGTAKANKPLRTPFCGVRSALCSEPMEPWGYNGQYIGHDEPSVLFYSDKAGAGNNNTYTLRLPVDPPTPPNQAGTGGTDNFQLHPAFWFGMAMCDTQSAPLPGKACAPDSDSNIYTSTDPNSEKYIGKHPGTAYMEMQFYPPAWVPWPAGNSCDPTKWCAALNIDSLSENQNTGQLNNGACLNQTGLEYVNFAFITKNGVAQAPANPVDSTLDTFTPNPDKDLFMGSGDVLTVKMHDTEAGFQVQIYDRTTGQSGSMTASIANQFGQVKFDPNGTTCQNIPYAFHPMYATSSENTRVVWAAHSYNVAYADEIGHFEYCNAVDPNTGNCTQAGVTDPTGVDGDDAGCFPASASTKIQISGCLGTDTDFDGPEYANNWPGTNPNPDIDKTYHSSAIEFTSPLINGNVNFSRVAFEADLPRIEFATTPPCNRHTGVGCVNPPVGATFYPFFTTTNAGEGSCIWQEGGPFIPGTTNTFGGSSTTEFGALLKLTYPSTGWTTTSRYNDFRQVLNYNPCRVGGNR